MKHSLIVSIPLVVILGALVYVAWRFMGLRTWHVIVVALFGFFLAATTAAPTIRQITTEIVRSLSSNH